MTQERSRHCYPRIRRVALAAGTPTWHSTRVWGEALGRLVDARPLACVVDVSELRQCRGAVSVHGGLCAFAEAVYETNVEPLHLVLDEADL